MPSIIIYLLKLSISLSVAWLFYRLVLRPLTFYTLNRWYLLGYSLLSFLIPFIDIGSFVAERDPASRPLVIQYIPTIANYAPANAAVQQQTTGWDPWTIVLIVLGAGMIFLLSRILIRWRSLVNIRRQARLLSDTDIRIYQVDSNITPFSFGNAIYINQRLHSEKEWEEIILHEYVHIRQRHTLDILLAEFITVLNWYNPFAWLIRHSIRQNLEFIADQKVLDNGVDKKGYQYHLLKVVGHPQYRLANNFNFSSLKKRIVMMNKIRSARLHLLKFLFLLPLLSILFLAFRDRVPGFGLQRTGPVYVNAAGIVIALPARTPLTGVVVREKRTGLQTTTDANGYYKLQILVSTDSVRIHLDYSKEGYPSIKEERFWPALKKTTGMLDVAPMETPSVPMKGMFVAIPDFDGTTPADPTYADAQRQLAKVLQQNVEINRFNDMKTSHPDVALFYLTEGRQQRLVIHSDGTAERYGYPDGPTLADMDKKYGAMPWFMRPEGRPAGKGYLDRWAAISSQAEKEFHPTGGDPRAIIFPGDSRVIAVSSAGKAEVYDMENNNDPKERPAFEKLYGKLPACVPVPGGSAPTSKQPPASPADTVPKEANMKIRIDAGPGNMELNKALLVVNGVVREDWSKDSLRDYSNNIASIDVIKGDEAFHLFGEKGAHGIIAVITKDYAKKHSPLPTATLPNHVDLNPLYIIDGVRLPMGTNWANLLDPEMIASINVIKDPTAAAVYGPEAAKKGVLRITTKSAMKGTPKETQKPL